MFRALVVLSGEVLVQVPGRLLGVLLKMAVPSTYQKRSTIFERPPPQVHAFLWHVTDASIARAGQDDAEDAVVLARMAFGSCERVVGSLNV